MPGNRRYRRSLPFQDDNIRSFRESIAKTPRASALRSSETTKRMFEVLAKIEIEFKKDYTKAFHH